jgi:hypothetical protein
MEVGRYVGDAASNGNRFRRVGSRMSATAANFPSPHGSLKAPVNPSKAKHNQGESPACRDFG